MTIKTPSTASPWAQLRKDEELRAEIKQDVDRCMQETPYFRLPETQRTMLDILFVYCRLNPDVSYRQGMHEILAPILWAVESDAIDLGQSSKAMGEDALIKDVFEAACIEHDAFALFGQIMQSAKNFYEQTTHQGAENPIVSRSRKIFTDLLPLVDAELAQHLERVDIVPQVFLIRWIRLIFGREFEFDDLLTIWDVIFAEDPTLEIVDHICLTMLLRMRWELIEADYNSALTLLLKYPVEDLNKEFQPQSLALDALYLREHMDYHGGSYLVSKYSGRSLLHDKRPATPPALQRNITTFTVPTAGKMPRGGSRPSSNHGARTPRGFESVLRSTAKNIYARGEELGIGKAVKGAVDEVHRRAQEIRDLQTPSPPANVRYRAPRGSVGSAASIARIKALEDRNRQLAKLLEGAVNELWAYQKDAAESEGEKSSAANDPITSSNLETLSMAIAKVQFVQVYLDDPGLPLPEEEETTQPDPLTSDTEADYSRSKKTHASETAASKVTANEEPSNTRTGYFQDDDTETAAATHPRPGPAQSLTDPSTFDDFADEKSVTTTNVPEIIVQEDTPKTKVTSPQQNARPESPRSRPPLEQSSFSWMLGQQDDPTSQPFTHASRITPNESRNRSFLFGKEDQGGKTGSRERRGSGKDGKKSPETKLETDEEFDMGSLRHGRKKLTDDD